MVGGLAVDLFQYAEGVTASGSTATFDLSGAGGYLVWRTKNASPLASGYATLDCGAPVVAQVLYASRDGSGTTTGMATVFSSQAGEGFQFPVLTPEATLGIAIANHTNTDASCRVVLEGPERQNLDQAPLPVPSKSNVVRFLYETIQIPDGFTEGSVDLRGRVEQPCGGDGTGGHRHGISAVALVYAARSGGGRNRNGDDNGPGHGGAGNSADDGRDGEARASRIAGGAGGAGGALRRDRRSGLEP